jgi:hypothetical protein
MRKNRGENIYGHNCSNVWQRMSILQADQTAEKYRARCNRDGGTTTSIGRFPNLSQGLVVTKHALTFLFNKYCS